MGTDGLPAFKKAQYPRAYPSHDKLLPFVGSLHPDLLTLTYDGPSPALILDLKAKKPKKNKDKKQDGIYADVAHLKCSGLDLCFQFEIGDRASVVGGILYSGVTGRVERVENGGSLLISIPRDIEVVGSTTISPGLEDHKIFTISFEHVTQIWELEDFVQVTCGDHKNATGFIVISVSARGGGGVAIYSSSQSRPVESESERLLGGIPNPGLLKVRAADLEFDPSSFTSNVAADLPLRALLLPTPEEFSQHHAAAWPQYTWPSNSGVYQDPQLQNLSPAVGEFTWGQMVLMYTGAWYAGHHFQVVVRGKHQWKGLRGEVIRDYNGPKRNSELAKGMTEFDCMKSSSVVDPCKGGEDASWKKYQDEIFVTIKEIGTHNTVSGIPLALVYHELTSIMPLKLSAKARYIAATSSPSFALEPGACFTAAASDAPDIMHVPGPELTSLNLHNHIKRVNQSARWQGEVLPVLLPELVLLLQESKSLRDLYGHEAATPLCACDRKRHKVVIVHFSAIQNVELEVCKCMTAAVQLMRLGAFGCTPLHPSLAVDLRVETP
ncbi:hypothetical protein B0H14DRAFT_3534943 [Mycena olivaceomarginata]|nr:hypothetical protein B0H14DRAFT_3534943 [Mycena olivaceomarginata]